MRILRVRRTKYLLVTVTVFLFVYMSTRYAVKFQINNQIDYYRKFFNGNFDPNVKQFNPLEIKQIPEQVIDSLYANKKERIVKKLEPKIDWTKLAYANYVSNPVYLCNTLIMFDELINEYHTNATLLLLVSDSIISSDKPKLIKYATGMLERIRALSETQVVVKTVKNIAIQNDFTEWSNSLTKLQIFNQVEYDRIIYLDNDASLMDHLDELFFLPDYVKFAAPVTYWTISEKDVKRATKKIKRSGNAINLNFYLRRIFTRIKENKVIYNNLPNLPHEFYLDSDDIGNDLLKTKTVFSISRIFHKGKKSKLKFTSDLMVLKPSATLFNSFINDILPTISEKDALYDMDIINEYFYNLKQIIYDHFTVLKSIKEGFTPEVLVLPFSRYSLLTGSIKNPKQHGLLKNDILGYQHLDNNGKDSSDDVATVVKNAKYIHYSDYPIMKPWVYEGLHQMNCEVDGVNKEEEKKICDLWAYGYAPYFAKRRTCTQA